MNISGVNNSFSALPQQDASLKTQIASLTKQIVKLSTQLQEIYRSEMPHSNKIPATALICQVAYLLQALVIQARQQSTPSPS